MSRSSAGRAERGLLILSSMKMLALPLLVLTLFAGCSSPPSDEEVAAKLVGVPLPLPGHVDVQITKTLGRRLGPGASPIEERLDPNPVPGWYETTFGRDYAWLVRVMVDSLDKGGRYTGKQLWRFFWRDQEIVRVEAPGD